MAKPIRHRDSATAVIYLRAPGWLKNEIAEHATGLGVTLTTWALNVLKEALDEERGIAPPPPAVAPVPTPQMRLRGLLAGEDVLEPCGKPAPCEREDTYWVGDAEFCGACRVRVH